MTNLDTFLQDLSSAAPVPGGGSVAALQTAMAASLLVMVANLTIGKRRFESVQEEAISIRTRAEALRDEAMGLAQDDVEAYRAVSNALALPRETDEQKQTRRRETQEALKGAVDPPLRTMRAASSVLALAQELVRVGNKSAISDVGTAALAARAGYHAGRLNVEINLNSITDDGWTGEVRRSMAGMPDPDGAERAVLETVSAVMAGEPG